MQGVVKVYDPETGLGVILLDDGTTEVALAPGSLRGSIFRTLRQGQRIVFDTRDDGGRTVATSVRLGSDGS
ncbi:MAG: cold shock domain-containing protein [Actinobacteria bacterium]|nr:cold shock domain-containing protein [Actinomycetota bacterium]